MFILSWQKLKTCPELHYIRVYVYVLAQRAVRSNSLEESGGGSWPGLVRKVEYRKVEKKYSTFLKFIKVKNILNVFFFNSTFLTMKKIEWYIFSDFENKFIFEFPDIHFVYIRFLSTSEKPNDTFFKLLQQIKILVSCHKLGICFTFLELTKFSVFFLLF